MVRLVSHAQELEAERHLDEAEHDFHGIQPAAALEFLQEGREHCEDGERQCESYRERQHCHHRSPELALGGLDEDGTDNRTGA